MAKPANRALPEEPYVSHHKRFSLEALMERGLEHLSWHVTA